MPGLKCYTKGSLKVTRTQHDSDIAAEQRKYRNGAKPSILQKLGVELDLAVIWMPRVGVAKRGG